MKYNPDIHHRGSICLKGYDYSKEGIYFITMCSHNRENIFGRIINETMMLDENGIIVKNTWFDLPNHNSNIALDEFIIMPNHVHGTITVGAGSKPALDVGVQPNYDAQTRTRAGLEPALTKENTLSEIEGQFKTFSSKKINKQRNVIGIPVWQRNFYEHIIRNEDELNKIRQYIRNNLCNWNADENFFAD